jgi:prepilin-type processing-associated H-X9-DG protein
LNLNFDILLVCDGCGDTGERWTYNDTGTLYSLFKPHISSCVNEMAVHPGVSAQRDMQSDIEVVCNVLFCDGSVGDGRGTDFFNAQIRTGVGETAGECEGCCVGGESAEIMGWTDRGGGTCTHV